MPMKRLHTQYLSDDDLSSIEETSYRLLNEVGISLQHAGATEMLHGLGCRVERGRTFIPPDVVRWGLDHVTPQKTLYSLDGRYAVPLGDGAIRFHNGGGPPFILNAETGERALATSDDLTRMTRLLDALPNVDEICVLFTPQEVPGELMSVISTAIMLRNTRKPVAGPGAENAKDANYIIEMAAACVGGREALRQRPCMTLAVSPVSPLIFTENIAAAIMAIAEAGIPFHSLPAPSLGATGPITLAGCLAQQHAEVLASLIIAAATRAGAPVMYCSRINPLDLRRAVSSWGGPEVGIASAGATQLAHRLGLCCDAYGLCTSASVLDPVFAYQRMANAMIPALAGADIMSGVGTIESGMAGCLEAAVIDDEIIGLIKHIVRGYEVSPETLAFDVMQEVIPSGGVFLSETHTVREMRKGAIWVPKLGDAPAGSSGDSRANVIGRARARVNEILRKHEVAPLPDDVQSHLDEIVARARREAIAE